MLCVALSIPTEDEEMETANAAPLQPSYDVVYMAGWLSDSAMAARAPMDTAFARAGEHTNHSHHDMLPSDVTKERLVATLSLNVIDPMLTMWMQC